MKLMSLLNSSLMHRNIKNINVSKPTSMQISKKAIIDIKGKLNFNCTYNSKQKKKLSIISIGDNSELVVNGQFSFFSGCKLGLLPNAKLFIGSGYMNFDSKIYCYDKIEIGNDVAISENVVIIDSDVHRIKGSKRPTSEPIKIGNKVWIGIGATILKGVTIGDGAIIGAGAVVTSDIPPRCMAVGVPARVIKENIEWE